MWSPDEDEETHRNSYFSGDMHETLQTIDEDTEPDATPPPSKVWYTILEYYLLMCHPVFAIVASPEPGRNCLKRKGREDFVRETFPFCMLSWP